MVLDCKIPRKILIRIPAREHNDQIPRKHWNFPRKVLDQVILREHTKKPKKILENTREILEWF